MRRRSKREDKAYKSQRSYEREQKVLAASSREDLDEIERKNKEEENIYDEVTSFAVDIGAPSAFSDNNESPYLKMQQQQQGQGRRRQQQAQPPLPPPPNLPPGAVPMPGMVGQPSEDSGGRRAMIDPPELFSSKRVGVASPPQGYPDVGGCVRHRPHSTKSRYIQRVRRLSWNLF